VKKFINYICKPNWISKQNSIPRIPSKIRDIVSQHHSKRIYGWQESCRKNGRIIFYFVKIIFVHYKKELFFRNKFCLHIRLRNPCLQILIPSNTPLHRSCSSTNGESILPACKHKKTSISKQKKFELIYKDWSNLFVRFMKK
jgi:hypothetical protein